MISSKSLWFQTCCHLILWSILLTRFSMKLLKQEISKTKSIQKKDPNMFILSFSWPNLRNTKTLPESPNIPSFKCPYNTYNLPFSPNINLQPLKHHSLSPIIHTLHEPQLVHRRQSHCHIVVTNYNFQQDQTKDPSFANLPIWYRWKKGM